MPLFSYSIVEQFLEINIGSIDSNGGRKAAKRDSFSTFAESYKLFKFAVYFRICDS